MTLLRGLLSAGMIFVAAGLGAQTAEPAASPTGATEQSVANTTAAAAVASGRAKPPETPEFIEHAVDMVLEQFDVTSSENSPTRYMVCALILVLTFLLRRVVTTILFAFLRRLSAKTETTLDDKLFGALMAPFSALIVVVGGVGAFKALKLSPSADNTLGYLYTTAFSVIMFWLALRAFNALLDHLGHKAQAKNLGVAAFMPWIKKTLIVIFVLFGVLMIAQSLGADVKAFLAGLGIGGLAVALAAQDTLANIFGSVVVAVDQPFKIGEFVQIGGSSGAVEDIGLRSTKLRRADKALIVVPNKIVASEAVTNLSRFTQRRVEHVVGLTYDTNAEQMDGIVEEFRQLILREEEVQPGSVMVYFRDFSASSLDIWVAYETKDPDFAKHMLLRQRLNLAIMRAVEMRKLAFAFPTRTMILDGPVARQLADNKKSEGRAET